MLNTVMLDALQSRHTTLEGLTVQIVTWNVNAKLEEMVQLRRLFFPEEEKCFGSTPEIIVLGLQEMIELSTSNVIGGAMMGDGTERVDQWRNMLLQVLKEKDKSFEAVTSKNMVGLWITVFALRSFKQHVSKIQVSSIGRGVGGVLGNKGAVYARFNIKDTSICFVCAHFAAHREHLLKRNEDFHAILYHRAFPGLLDNAGTADCTNLSQHNAAHMNAEAAKVARMQERIHSMKRALNAAQIPVSPPINVKKEQLANYTRAADHDIVIWLGDLNYRLLGGMENSRIYDTIDGRRSFALLSVDQLNIEKEKGTVFQGFHEGLITFDPTYKYTPGTPNYNRERCPAWCDRVLWKLKKSDLDLCGYLELDSYVCEDHFAPPVQGEEAAQGEPSNERKSFDYWYENSLSHSSGKAEKAVLPDGAEPESAEKDTQAEIPSSSTAEVAAVETVAPAEGNCEVAVTVADTDAVENSCPAGSVSVLPLPAAGVTFAAPDTTSDGAIVEHYTAAVVDASADVSAPESGAESVLEMDAIATENDPDSADICETNAEAVPAPAAASPSRRLARPLSQIIPDSRVSEIVELMVYNRGENIISDHKPVRALMSVKFKRVDWAAHERHLVRHFTARCHHRPHNTLSHTMIHGVAPVAFAPRVVTLFCTVEGCTQVLELTNHTANKVRFQLAQALPAWLSISPSEGMLHPGQRIVLQVCCDKAVAESSIIESLGLDALHADDQLREVWRRHTRIPDERGNPQLTAVLQVELFTAAVSASNGGVYPQSSGGNGSYASPVQHGVVVAEASGADAVAPTADVVDDVTFPAGGSGSDEGESEAGISCEVGTTQEGPCVQADTAEDISAEVSQRVCADQPTTTQETHVIEEVTEELADLLCVAMSPLLVPIVCKISQ